MHLHFEKNTNTKCDCSILSLSWMGKVPDDIPEVSQFPGKKKLFLLLLLLRSDFCAVIFSSSNRHVLYCDVIVHCICLYVCVPFETCLCAVCALDARSMSSKKKKQKILSLDAWLPFFKNRKKNKSSNALLRTCCLIDWLQLLYE